MRPIEEVTVYKTSDGRTHETKIEAERREFEIWLSKLIGSDSTVRILARAEEIADYLQTFLIWQRSIGSGCRGRYFVPVTTPPLHLAAIEKAITGGDVRLCSLTGLLDCREYEVDNPKLFDQIDPETPTPYYRVVCFRKPHDNASAVVEMGVRFERLAYRPVTAIDAFWVTDQDGSPAPLITTN